jgi:hypothetical protein
MPVKWLVCFVALAFIPGVALAQWAGWDYDFDEEKKSWKEIEAQIPPYPSPKNLLYLEAGGGGHRLYIDANSVSRGEDGVMRYTAVVKASGGATNVSFEGMRCETREQKTYALGHSDGSWARARSPQWRRIELREILPYHYVLYREYFCPSRTRPPTAWEAVDALKQSRSIFHSEEGRQRP